MPRRVPSCKRRDSMVKETLANEARSAFPGRDQSWSVSVNTRVEAWHVTPTSEHQIGTLSSWWSVLVEAIAVLRGEYASRAARPDACRAFVVDTRGRGGL